MQTRSSLSKRRSADKPCSTASTSSSATLRTVSDSAVAFKRHRVSTPFELDGDGNKENVAPGSPIALQTPPQTPSLRRTHTEQFNTPTSRQIRPLPGRSVSLNASSFITPPLTPPTVHARARTLLRATGTAASMAGRDKERAVITAFVQNGTEHNILYISGTPGTGKTALVDEVIAHAGGDTKVVRVNCVGYPLATAESLWQLISSDLGSSPAPRKKTRTRVKPTVSSTPAIVILDEMDHLPRGLETLITLAQEHNTMRIIGIANTHTLTTSSSTLVQTLHFAPYTADQLQSIAQTRLSVLDSDTLSQVITPSGLKLLASKLATRTGDARTLLAVLCGAISIAGVAGVPVGPPHVLSALRTHAPVQTGPAPSSEIAQVVSTLGLHSRLALAALLLPNTPSVQDSSSLHKTYTSLRGPTAPLAKGEFLDILSGLEVNGILSVSSPSSTPTNTPTKGRGSLKRCMSSNTVMLAPGVHRDDILRTLQLVDEFKNETLDVCAEEVRSVWRTELSRRARVQRNQAMANAAANAGKDAFGDAFKN